MDDLPTPELPISKIFNEWSLGLLCKYVLRELELVRRREDEDWGVFYGGCEED